MIYCGNVLKNLYNFITLLTNVPQIINVIKYKILSSVLNIHDALVKYMLTVMSYFRKQLDKNVLFSHSNLINRNLLV